MKPAAQKAGLAGLAIVLFGFAAYQFFWRGGGTELPSEYTIKGVCLACKQEAEAVYRSGEEEPFTCKKCGERAVYSWWYCMACNKRFIPEMMKRPDGPPKVPPMPRCPGCGSPRTGAWVPDDPTQSAKGDVPLPAWP